MKMMLYGLAVCVLIAVLAVLAYLQHPKFGERPSGARLAALKQSLNYAGEFQNLIETPMFTEDRSFLSVLIENLRTSGERLRPPDEVPLVRTDLHALDRQEDVVGWLGHSSFYVQLGGKRILIDPVFSEGAAPIALFNRAFAGSSGYSAADMPPIDALLITHDHWDHLDYPSILSLQPKVDQVVTGLGVGAYFEGWGYAGERIREGDWFDRVELGDGVVVHLIPARHYSGRMLTRRQTLWTGFVLETPSRRLLFSGDSGYGPHFAEIGARFGGFDLAALDSGQYDPRWAYIHMNPEQAAQAAVDLKAAALLPAHVGRFTLAKHAWDEPFQRISRASADKSYQLLTPRIGEPIRLADDTPAFSRWWESVQPPSQRLSQQSLQHAPQ